MIQPRFVIRSMPALALRKYILCGDSAKSLVISSALHFTRSATIMIFLRIFSFIAGGFTLLGSPFFLLGKYTSGPSLLVLMAALTVLLFASVYFFFGVIGHRIARSQRLRYIASALIGFQLLAGAWLLAASQDARALVAVAPLLCFTVMLFMGFVWPAEAVRTHRPMRRRERMDELHYH
jgi:hypothetical protein